MIVSERDTIFLFFLMLPQSTRHLSRHSSENIYFIYTSLRSIYLLFPSSVFFCYLHFVSFQSQDSHVYVCTVVVFYNNGLFFARAIIFEKWYGLFFFNNVSFTHRLIIIEFQYTAAFIHFQLISFCTLVEFSRVHTYLHVCMVHTYSVQYSYLLIFHTLKTNSYVH